MRVLPDTVAGRTILVMLISLLASHLLSVFVYHTDMVRRVSSTSEHALAERLLSAKGLIEIAPPAQRDAIAHAVSSRDETVHWMVDAPLGTEPAPEALDSLAGQIMALLPETSRSDLRVAYEQAPGADARPDEGSRRILASAKLKDGSWVTVTAPPYDDQGLLSSEAAISTTIMALAIIAVAAAMVRFFTRPLRSLAVAAERFGRDVMAPALPETGPRETRMAATAFNGMQERIRKLLNDRTQMLAAMSHDLRTPITRLKLEAEFVGDEDQRRRMLRDLDDMEAMVGSTLAFLKDGSDAEPLKVVDVSTLVASVCEQMEDAGMPVVYRGVTSAPLSCRPMSLKRAFSNIIDNAVKYGAGAEVSMAQDADRYVVLVSDNGPGISLNEQKKVFAPFYRVESSRSRETGGTGLGLSIAQSIIRAHGGEISLENKTEGGLRVRISLPRQYQR